MEWAVLTTLGFATVALVLVLLLTNRVAAVVALIGVPVVTAFAGGFSPAEVGGFITDGIGGVVDVAAMFVFAILFFGVLRDAGMFTPIVRGVLRLAGRNPVTVTLATALLAAVAHLDGAGAVTFLITIPALLPLYDELRMSRLVLTTVTGLSAGVMNMVPWGGPTARAAATVKVDANQVWVPLIPAQVAGLVAVFVIAYVLGRREKTRLARLAADAAATVPDGGDAGLGVTAPDADPDLARPRMFWVNVALTVATIAALIWGGMPPEAVFMLALIVALVLNYPGLKSQTARINAHAQGAILMASTLLAAGAFLGVMEKSGMTAHMAHTLTTVVPHAVGSGLPVVAGALGVPASLLFGPDAYYFGVLPVLTGLGHQLGVAPLHLAQASVLGEETVGFPISPLTGSFFLLVGLAGVNIGSHIRRMLPWAWLVNLVMLATAVAMGVIPV